MPRDRLSVSNPHQLLVLMILASILLTAVAVVFLRNQVRPIRALAILLVPIVVLQLVVGLVFFQRHYQRVTEQMTRNVAYELTYASEQVEAAGDAEEAATRLAALALPLGLELRLVPDQAVVPGVRRDFLDLTGATVVATLDRAFGSPLRIDLATNPRAAQLAIGTRRGVIEAEVPRDRLSVSNAHQLQHDYRHE